MVSTYIHTDSKIFTFILLGVIMHGAICESFDDAFAVYIVHVSMYAFDSVLGVLCIIFVTRNSISRSYIRADVPNPFGLRVLYVPIYLCV